MAVMAVWAAVLITYGVSIGVPMVSSIDSFDLDMADNSVDDMYDGCKGKMQTKVEKEYLPNEKTAWLDKVRNAERDAERIYNEQDENTKSKLEKEQIMALHAYTAEGLYGNFIKATRTQRSEYKTGFNYHALHFFLTTAIQTLNPEKRCYDAYRGVRSSYNNVARKKRFRFGSFASSSKFPDVAEGFGTKSCFEIRTCHGADITQFSVYGNEGEVLIPPYEVFEVTQIKKKSQQRKIKCDVVYKVRSKRTLSKLNCNFFKNKLLAFFSCCSK